ncbi:MAG: acyl-CoA desaturase [Myxococcota bacterium]
MTTASSAARASADPCPNAGFPSEAERLESFRRALDAIKDRVTAELGAEDVDYVVKLDRRSRQLELVGRLLIHFSPEPLSFLAGVVALWLHKQLQATEIGHPALHGAWDGLAGAEAYRSDTYRWDTPIDEESWRYGHNIRHHQYTNVAGKDPDIHFGGVRLTEEAGTSPTGLPTWAELMVAVPNFGLVMNAHFSGLIDAYFGNGRPGGLDFLPDRSRASLLAAHKKAFRKYVPYYLKNYVLFPALAGAFFWKVLLGNWLAETMRDVYTAATIYCGHVGSEVSSYPEGTRAHGRGEWYAMQVEASNDFRVSPFFSVLCGALDYQIEHHLFPRLPPNRLRQIAGEVEAVCRAHGVKYRAKGWGETLREALRQAFRLSKRGGPAALEPV